MAKERTSNSGLDRNDGGARGQGGSDCYAARTPVVPEGLAFQGYLKIRKFRLLNFKDTRFLVRNTEDGDSASGDC